MDMADALLHGRTADPVKLAFADPETLSAAFIDSLDLSLVQELRRGKDGAIELKLVDKLRLAELCQEHKKAAEDDPIERLMTAIGGDKK